VRGRVVVDRSGAPVRGFLGCLGLGLAIASAPFVVFAIGGLVDNTVTSAALLAFFGATGYAGYRVAQKNLFAPPPARPALPAAVVEHRVLEHAAGHGGRITVAELALKSGLSIDDSRNALDEMVRKGVANVLVTDDGATVYDFPELLTAQERRSAKDPLLS
jgi:hypothetical protein